MTKTMIKKSLRAYISCDPQQHIDNIQKLAELFNNDEVIEALADAHTPEDLIAIQEKFLD